MEKHVLYMTILSKLNTSFFLKDIGYFLATLDCYLFLTKSMRLRTDSWSSP